MSKIEELKSLGWEMKDFVELLEELHQALDSKEGIFMGKKEVLDKRVSILLRKMGMPTHIKGFCYVKAAIVYCLQKEDRMNISMTKELYPTVAEQFSTSSSRVERGIRNAVERTFYNNDPLLTVIFGNSVNQNKGKPTNSEFISMVAEYLSFQGDVSIK